MTAAGGKVLGAARHPLNTADFSSFLLQAQASGADVIGLANAGGDLNNAIKQAHEFGLTAKQRLAGFVLNVTNIPSLGLEAVQNAAICTPFYWDFNDGTRDFAKRFQAAHPSKMKPNDMHAGMYAATLHLMKAMAQTKSADDGVKLIDAMKAIPTDDPLFGKGSIRIDGRKLHPVYLMTPRRLPNRRATGIISSSSRRSNRRTHGGLSTRADARSSRRERWAPATARAAMRNWLRSPTLLKLFVGQHVLNGLSVALGVMAVAAVASALFGFAAGQPATLGAISASISDFPAPWRVKAAHAADRLRARGRLDGPDPARQPVADGAGRRHRPHRLRRRHGHRLRPLGAGAQRATAGADGVRARPAAAATGARAAGGAAADRRRRGLHRPGDRRDAAGQPQRPAHDGERVDPRARRLFARRRAIHRSRPPTSSEVYGAAIRQQAALADQLQAARALLLERPRATPERVRLAATIGVLLDSFDAVVAAQCDLPRLARLAGGRRR